MPSSSRLLYYDLGMNADDEGVVEAFSIMRMTGATEDDLRVLISKGFVSVLNEELVTYILDWDQNNLIRKDRFQESFYHELLIQMKKNDEQQRRLATIGNDVVNQRLTEDRIGKDSLGEGSLNKELIAPPSADSDAEVFDKLPCLSNQTYIIHTDEVETYNKRFPAVDVEQELRNAISWVEANPRNRKTLSGAKRFLTNWLIKSQNRTRAYSTQAKKGDEIFYDTK